MRTKLAALGLLIVITGCHRPAYYRVEVGGGYTYWREYHKTTFHGLCANMYGNNSGTLWEVDHPYGQGVSKVSGELPGSSGTDIHTFKSKEEAATWAESVCPTK